LVYGGCSSGKSSLAEELLQGITDATEKIYIATMWPEGRDAEKRIQRHRSARAHKGFTSLECYTDIGSLVVPPGSAVLLECIAGLVANEMFQPQGAHEAAEEAILGGIALLAAQAKHLIVVSNDVGADGFAYDEGTLAYQNAIAALNRELCALSNCAIEMVCGIPVFLKGGETWRL